MRDSKAKTSKPLTAPAQPSEESVCAGHALGFPLKNTLGFQPIENLTLDVFRCVCDVYSSGSAQPWEIAMKIAEEQLGAPEGTLLVARVTALLRALRRERARGFSYLGTGCQHVSPDELAMTGLLKSARNGDDAAVERGIALALDNAEETERTRLAVRSRAAGQVRNIRQQPEQDGKSEFENQTVQAVYLH